MSKIRILDSRVANQIAAGEVIERPSSVVKELVENSIDAKSNKINIEVWKGGLEAIKVTDNGEGMTADDVKLAFFRHATSKIRSENDLFNITTLGFRGEALPSIAAVSQIQILTRTKDQLEGTRATFEAGDLQGLEPAGCPAGTQIWVKNIFYNTPARKKFIKSPSKENSTIVTAVTRFALSNPHISFRLVIDGRVVLQTSGNNDLLDVVGSVYTVDIAKNLLPVNKSFSNWEISGFISQSQLSRTNRDMQNFFVNHRYVHNLKLSKALEAGYADKLPINRYPLCILNLSIPANQLDVNVHPTKLEVRIDREAEICSNLTDLVAESLGNLNPVKKVSIKAKPLSEISSYSQVELKLSEKPNDSLKDKSNSYSFKIAGKQKVKGKEEKLLNEIVREKAVYFTGTSPELKEQGRKSFPFLTPIGQLYDSYILAQGDSGLYIIDQHAAHERIYYEKFKDRREGLHTQMLAVPISIELTFSEVNKLIDNILLFNKFGIIIEHFGDNSFILRGLPQGFSAQEGQDLISYLVSELDLTKIEKLVYEDYIKLLACKKAIKAKQKLSLMEMGQLIDDLSQTNFPYTCPHGRPTIISFSIKELEKKFLRT